MKHSLFLTLFFTALKIIAFSQGLEAEKQFSLPVYPTFVWQERGNLDSTFGIQGKATSFVSSISGGSVGSFLQPDGRIVVYGGNTSSIVLTRFTENGTVDLTFGSNGTAVLVQPGVGIISAILLSDGKIILVCGDFFFKTVLFRLNSGGAIDPTFGINGSIVLFQNGTAATSAAKQIDGKIVITARGNNGGQVIRFDSNGVLDSEFGLNGIVVIPMRFTQDVKVQGDGKILVGGSVMNAGIQNSALVRVNPNGSLDPTFGINGLSETNLHTNEDRIYSLAIQPDGKIIAGGGVNITNGSSAISALARFNTDGSLDQSFNSNGVLIGIFPQSRGPVVSIAIQSDGKILAAGDPYFLLGIARIESNGTLDVSSELNNTLSYYPQIAAIASGGSTYPKNIYIQPDGKILMVGDSTSGQITSFFLARLNPNPLVQTRGIRGRVVNQKNRGISRIMIRIQNNNTGENFTVLTNQFGYFGLSNLPLYHSYTIFTNKKSGFLLPFFNFQLTEDTGEMVLQTNS